MSERKPWTGELDFTNGETTVQLRADAEKVTLDVIVNGESKIAVRAAQSLLTKKPSRDVREHLEGLARSIAGLFGVVTATVVGQGQDVDVQPMLLILLTCVEQTMQETSPRAVAMQFHDEVGGDEVKRLLGSTSLREAIEAVESIALDETIAEGVLGRFTQVWGELERMSREPYGHAPPNPVS